MSNRVEVESKVLVYEKDGREIAGAATPTISVRSHWNRPAMVVLDVDGATVTVLASDLRAAIQNATNAG